MRAPDLYRSSFAPTIRRAVELDQHLLVRNASCQHSVLRTTFCASGRLTTTTSTKPDRAWRMLRCSCFSFGRPDEASQAVLRIVFIVISMAVRARLVHLVAPANIMFE